MFTYATVCSGVEGCSLALEGMDWRPIFFSEIEPFPCAVLRAKYPQVPNLGDMSKISYKDGVITNGTVDIEFRGRLDLLAGGTPCQDFSVAGKRAGGGQGSGTRSSLMWEWLRLARELKPRILLWENVAGTFSSNEGRDFYEFVRALDEIGYCVSWRVLDCQYTRVDKWPMAIPQRRRRVWLVGCAGGNITEIAKILFEPTSLVGDTPPSRSTRQAVAGASQYGNRLDAPMVGRKRVEGFFDNIRTGFPTTGDDVNHTVCTANRYQGVIEEVCAPKAMCFDPRHTAQFGESATAMECDLTQTADQYKQPHGVAIVGTIDLMGGKTGAHYGDGEASPTLTHGRGSASDVHAIVSTNSNGGDVMPTINANEAKLGGDNQHIRGGGTLSVNFEMYDSAEDVNVSLCAKRARDCMVVTDEKDC